MKVYVTQGHEKGIGLEVFFKSLVMISKEDRGLIRLLAFKPSVIDTLKSLNLPFEILDETIMVAGVEVATYWLSEINNSQSFSALDMGMRLCESEANSVLFTLPTSKDQFPGYSGHTEYFRAFYNKPHLGMFFSSPKIQMLLLTDHVAIKDLHEVLTEELIYERIRNAVVTLGQWGKPIKRVLVAGINPHAGEGGLIGTEDGRVSKAIGRIRDSFEFDILGPLSGDTMLLEQKAVGDLLIYPFHDQGLGVFKSIQGFIGSNITLGLTYPRFSPDHGTSFSLFGKNLADYRGCSFALKEAICILKRISHEKNSSHKSKSS